MSINIVPKELTEICTNIANDAKEEAAKQALDNPEGSKKPSPKLVSLYCPNCGTKIGVSND